MDLTNRLRAARTEYETVGITMEGLGVDPVRQFEAWMSEAIDLGVTYPDAVVLSTADARGRPSSRAVLLKGVDARGFVFYSNYQSTKGTDLAENPMAALLFLWQEVHRQVRVAGIVARTTAAESDAYFASRPRGAQLAAAISAQSRPVADRETLERAVAELDAATPGEVPRPEHWGGYRLYPQEIEFWQGRRNRLHDRILYVRSGDEWTRSRLAP